MADWTLPPSLSQATAGASGDGAAAAAVVTASDPATHGSRFTSESFPGKTDTPASDAGTSAKKLRNAKSAAYNDVTEAYNFLSATTTASTVDVAAYFWRGDDRSSKIATRWPLYPGELPVPRLLYLDDVSEDTASEVDTSRNAATAEEVDPILQGGGDFGLLLDVHDDYWHPDPSKRRRLKRVHPGVIPECAHDAADVTVDDLDPPAVKRKRLERVFGSILPRSKYHGLVCVLRGMVERYFRNRVRRARRRIRRRYFSALVSLDTDKDKSPNGSTVAVGMAASTFNEEILPLDEVDTVLPTAGTMDDEVSAAWPARMPAVLSETNVESAVTPGLTGKAEETPRPLTPPSPSQEADEDKPNIYLPAILGGDETLEDEYIPLARYRGRIAGRVADHLLKILDAMARIRCGKISSEVAKGRKQVNTLKWERALQAALAAGWPPSVVSRARDRLSAFYRTDPAKIRGPVASISQA